MAGRASRLVIVADVLWPFAVAMVLGPTRLYADSACSMSDEIRKRFAAHWPGLVQVVRQISIGIRAAS